MQPTSIKPDVERFIEEQVNSGSFASRDAVIEAALLGMMSEQGEHSLTGEDMAAIELADAQIDRGEFVDFAEFATKAREKYLTP